MSPTVHKDAVKITTTKKENILLFFFTLFILYILSLSVSISFFFVCVCCLSHSNRRKSRDKEEKKPLHMGKYELLSNPKNLGHSEELTNKLNNTFWKQTLRHIYQNQNWESEGHGNSQHKHESTSYAATKTTKILSFRKRNGIYKKWEIIALFIQPLWNLSHIPVSRLRQCIKTDTAADKFKTAQTLNRGAKVRRDLRNLTNN